MNKRQLREMGVPEDCVSICIETVRDARMCGVLNKNQIKRDIALILQSPENYTQDKVWSSFSQSILRLKAAELVDKQHEPIDYKVWGAGEIDKGSHDQLRVACRLPSAVGAALMPDAHVGYGLPIGGVLATEGTVVPYAVGVDIACRMRLTVLDTPVESLDSKRDNFRKALEKGTLFGTGKAWQNRKQHDVLDEDWSVTSITKSLKDRAWSQLGTSGSGNHFVEFGTLQIDSEEQGKWLNLPPGRYVALLSHSGSRGPGAEVCKLYTTIAQKQLPKRYEEDFKYLAWLSLDSNEGQEYWAAMNLMGNFAAANHAVIHRDVVRLLGGNSIATVENHHNFAWKEIHNGKEVVVHRKGATPAGKGVLGVIPGSMADAGYVVVGKGNTDSLLSASHGAGRKMSRNEAKSKFNWKMWKEELAKRNVELLSAGIDEVPGAYKSIEHVMAAQTDLVDVVARFDPRIVKMCDDQSKPED